MIATAPKSGLAAPRPYPELADLGFQWRQHGSYWIAYDPAIPIIAGVFFDSDDIPSRVG